MQMRTQEPHHDHIRLRTPPTFDQQYGLESQIAQLNKAGCDTVFAEATEMDTRPNWTALIAKL